MSNEKKVLMKIEHLTKEFEIKSKKCLAVNLRFSMR